MFTPRPLAIGLGNSSVTVTNPTHSSVNPAILAWRLFLFALHIGLGLLAVLLLFPFCQSAFKRSLKNRWSKYLLATLGVTLKIEGKLPQGSLLLVANHVSWLDIYLINSLAPVAFVSKADVRQWPLIGWLAAHNDTIFLKRGSRGHAHIINTEIAKVLADGCPVTVFPEGTTTEGNTLLHFHGALLQPALSVGAKLVPLAIRYYQNEPSIACPAAAYAGDTTLGACVLAIAGCRNLTAQLVVLPPLEGNDRKLLAIEARQSIANRLNI